MSPVDNQFSSYHGEPVFLSIRSNVLGFVIILPVLHTTCRAGIMLSSTVHLLFIGLLRANQKNLGETFQVNQIGDKCHSIQNYNKVCKNILYVWFLTFEEIN